MAFSSDHVTMIEKILTAFPTRRNTLPFFVSRPIQACASETVCICALNFVMEQALGGGVLALVAGFVLWRYHRVAVKQFGGITGDLAGWFLQKAELYMLAALVFCQWKGFL